MLDRSRVRNGSGRDLGEGHVLRDSNGGILGVRRYGGLGRVSSRRRGLGGLLGRDLRVGRNFGLGTGLCGLVWDRRRLSRTLVRGDLLLANWVLGRRSGWLGSNGVLGAGSTSGVSRDISGRVDRLGDGNGEGLGDVDAGGPVLGVVSLRLVRRLSAGVANCLGDDGGLGSQASGAGVEVGCGDDSGGALGGLGDSRSSTAVKLVLGSIRGLGGLNRGWVDDNVFSSLGRDSRDRGRVDVILRSGRGSLRSLAGDNVVASGVLDWVLRRSLAGDLRDLGGLRVVGVLSSSRGLGSLGGPGVQLSRGSVRSG